MSSGTATPTILLESGQDLKKEASNLVFFVYVTPTGAEVSMGKCPHLKRVWGRSEGGFEGRSRLQRTEYQVMAPVRIKLVNVCTTFGSPKRMVNLFIDLDPNAAVIEVTGLEDFGKFKGRGKVDVKRSIYREHATDQHINLDILKGMFNYHIIQPPRKGSTRRVRSLII